MKNAAFSLLVGWAVLLGIAGIACGVIDRVININSNMGDWLIAGAMLLGSGLIAAAIARRGK